MRKETAKRVLAVDPYSRGVGFVVLEGHELLIDWGLRSTGKADNAKAARVIDKLIDRFRPDVLALEDWDSDGSRRCKRVETLLDRIASKEGPRVLVRLITRRQICAIGPLRKPARNTAGRASLRSASLNCSRSCHRPGNRGTPKTTGCPSSMRSVLPSPVPRRREKSRDHCPVPMDSFKDSLAYWSSIFGTVLSVLGLSESSLLLAVLGSLLLAVSVTALAYAQRQRQRLRLAAVKIEGRSIDSLNTASLGRRLNRSLIVQEADQVATINGEDLVMTLAVQRILPCAQRIGD